MSLKKWMSLTAVSIMVLAIGFSTQVDVLIFLGVAGVVTSSLLRLIQVYKNRR